MPQVLHPVLDVPLSECGVLKHEQVLGVVLFRCCCKVKAACNDGSTVNDDHFIVGDCMRRIDESGDAGMGDEIGG